MIDLSKYKLVQPLRIKKTKGKKTMYDITVKDDHTFHVSLREDVTILSHNCDGAHITSLLINFFHKWFPQIINNHKLFQLVTPLVVCDYNKERKYFYSLEEFAEFSQTNKTSNVNYLKGLGSLNMDDWQFVMHNKVLFDITPDRSANKYLEMAFGASSQKRKTWLENG